MTFINKKNLNILIALFSAVLMIASAFAVIPYAHATTTTYHTWLYVASSAQAQPVGVGKNMLIVAWTADMPPDIGEQENTVPSPSGRAGWTGMKINVTDPDGISTILDMPYSDPVGANYINYTPTKVGTYQVQAIFPLTDKVQTVTALGQFGNTYAGDHYIYSAATSPIATFVVVENAPSEWVESPITTDYWTRPISGASRQWYPLAGDWLGPSGSFTASTGNNWPIGSAGGGITGYAYGDAPTSAHVLWTKPFYIGGIADERFNDSAYATEHYQGVSFSPNVILDGKISWSPYYSHAGTQGWQVIDLYTGETLYTNMSQNCPNMGSIYQYESPNQHGEFAYLWETGGSGGFFGTSTPVQLPQIVILSRAKPNPSGNIFGAPIWTGAPYTVNTSKTPITTGTVWKMIDAHTLNTITYIANVSSAGTQVYGKDGSYLYYNIVGTPVPGNPFAPATGPFRVTVWNSSAGTMVASQEGTGYWQWRPAGGDFGASSPYFGSGDFNNPIGTVYNIVHDGNLFYSANFSIPDVTGGSIETIRQDDTMIVGSTGSNTKNGVTQGWLIGISLRPGNLGTQLWKTTFTPPFVDLDKNVTQAAMFTGGFSLTGVYPEQGVFTFGEVKQLKAWVFDLNSGSELWETNSTYAGQNQYNYYGQSQLVIGNELILYGGYSGTMTAFNVKTGNVDWIHNFISVGTESPYGNYPIQIGAASGDKIYVQTWEHSFTIPLYRGPNLSCINATDGTIVWDDLSFGPGIGIADGILVANNAIDNEIYAYGRGPSGTTVSAPQIIPSLGQSVMLTGTVTDQTPTGRRDTNDKVVWTLQGTPAVSDDSMTAWMDYKFQQQIYPTNATGVPVSLDIIDPNGNSYNIGTVTTDLNGKYSISFKPDIPGNYQIIASFAGSKSYGPSSDTTYLSVGGPEASTPTAIPSTESVADTYFVPAIAGLFILIIIVLVLVVLMMLRKRS
jgi:hypothetical protein